MMIFTPYRTFLILFFLLFSISSSSATSSEQIDEKQPVSPTTAGVELKSEGSLYWLQFATDADSLWPILKEFWSTEGISLKFEQPALGYMETEWINNTELEKYRSILLSDKAPEFRERFRLRVERLADNSGSRVFIHHTSYGVLFDEEAVYSGYLPPSPQLEIEMLSRLALFTGADKNRISKIRKNYRPTQLQIQATENNTYEIHMPGTTEFVHKKLIQALDRMDIQIKIAADGSIIATQTSASKINNPDAEKENEEWEIDDNSDLEEEGFALWSNDSANDKQAANIIYKLKLTENNSDTLIHISNHTKNTKDNIKLFSEAISRNLNK